VFSGSEQPLFFRKIEMGHRVLGDGAIAILPEHFAAHFWSGVQKGRDEVRIALE
jgi:hypothetical protein